jgi:hypothetical protein
VTKAKACKVAGQEGSLGVTPHAPGNVGKCEGMNPYTSKGASTLGVGIPMDFHQIFKERLQGSKFNGLRNSLYHWKSLEEGYNFALDFISIGGLHAKLWAPKVAGILVVRISRLPLGSPETKCHSDVSLVKKHRVYYKGEGGGFPQVRAVVNLVSPSLLVAHPNTKSVLTMH